MSNYSYNVVIERLKAFADGHYQIRKFSHGQIDVADMPNDYEYPFMHVVPVSINPIPGEILYNFQIIFADLPRDKEAKAEYQREAISDCARLALDLIAEIQSGRQLFGTEVEIETTPTIEPFIEEYKNTLTGVDLGITIKVPYDWSACDIPADYNVFQSGSSGGSGSGSGGIILRVNGVNNGSQTILDLIAGDNITITDNGDGTVTFDVTGGAGGGLTCEDLAECQIIQDINIELDGAKMDIGNLQTSLSGKENVSNKDTDATLSANSNTKYPSQKAVKTYIDTGLSGKEDVANKDTDDTLAANSNTRYPSQKAIKTYVDTGLSTKANTSHTHSISDVTGLQTALDGKASTSHTHAISDVTGLQTALDNKVDENAAITGATKTKITYDSKGLVTAGEDIVASDISNSTDVGRNLVTLTNPSAISFLRVNANNTVTARTPAQVLTDLGISANIVIAKDYGIVSVTNTLTNTLTTSALIAANTLQANDFIDAIGHFNTNIPNGTQVTYRLYINTSASLVGATQLGILTNSVGTGNVAVQRYLYITAIGTSGNIRTSNTLAAIINPYGFSSLGVANITINTTIDQYLIWAIQMAGNTSTSSQQANIITLTR